MKRLISILTLLTVSTVVAFSQNPSDEQELLKIHAGLEQAYKNRDIAPFEARLADDYVGAFPDGVAMTRAEVLEEMRTCKA